MTSFLSPTQAPRCHTRPVEFSTWYSSVNQSLSVDCGAFFFWHGHWRRVLSAAHNYLANHSCHLRHSNIVLRPSKEIWSFFFRPSIQYFSHYFSSLRTSSSSLRAFFFDRSGFTALAHRNKEVARLSHRRVEVVIIIARHDPSWCWLARRKWKGKKKKEQKTKWENHRLVRNGGSDVEISLVSPSFPFVPPFVWRNFLSWLVRCVIVFCFADPIDVGPPPAVRRSLFFFLFSFFFWLTRPVPPAERWGVLITRRCGERERERERKKKALDSQTKEKPTFTLTAFGCRWNAKVRPGWLTRIRPSFWFNRFHWRWLGVLRIDLIFDIRSITQSRRVGLEEANFFFDSIGIAIRARADSLWLAFMVDPPTLAAGAFLIAYFVAMIFCGIPIFFQEVALGQYLGAGGMTFIGEIVPIMKGNVVVVACVFLLFLFLFCFVLVFWFLSCAPFASRPTHTHTHTKRPLFLSSLSNE